jgi:AAA domain, putative AbiEii toxin, Type IV TA system
MFRVKLTDFRCFTGSSKPVELLPITFLVGENSAGKTTFLAAARLLLESFVRAPQNPFNKDPYYLGGFDQIAHYRGGMRGRAKQFSLSLEIPASTVVGTTPARGPRATSVTTKHTYVFGKGFPQPNLTRYEFDTQDISVVLDLSGKTPSLKSMPSDMVDLVIQDRIPPIELLRRDLSYLRFVFDELAFGPRKGGDRNISSELLDQFRASTRMCMRKVFASAPVRSEPRRTYTPSEIVASSEGSHVPLEMARQRISSPEEWKTVREKLTQFGKNSGLFDGIDIRMLGKKDGDPFQILVQTGGPFVNLVDVGYGVSQALPIIYQLEQPRVHDAFFLQQPEVHLHPRAQAELGSTLVRLSKQRTNYLYLIETHSDYIIDRVRTEIAAKRIDNKSVTIVFFDKQEHEVVTSNIYLSPSGDILDPPANFRKFFLEEHARLLGIA